VVTNAAKLPAPDSNRLQSDIGNARRERAPPKHQEFGGEVI
jgi:hypothetical protein